MNCNNDLPDGDGPFPGVTEGYYLETREGLFFAVKGFEHPPDRLIAVLRYAPDPEGGDRQKAGKSYRRFYHFAEQEGLIQAAYPWYLAYDPVFQTTLQSVPRSQVQRIYSPRPRLRELRQAIFREGIEEDAVAFTSLLEKEAAIPPSTLGITGSLLIGLHAEMSDLDIAVFGTQNCTRAYRALRRLLDGQSAAELQRLDARGIDNLYAQRAADTHMAFREFVSMENRKVNQGTFRNRTYFIRFIKEAWEAGGIYGHLQYTPLGRAIIAASIADDQGAIFTPCRYLVSSVRGLECATPPDLNEIVSFRGRFCQQACAGESVVASGTLERVQNGRGEIWHRLLLGTSPEDIMVVRR